MTQPMDDRQINELLAAIDGQALRPWIVMQEPEDDLRHLAKGIALNEETRDSLLVLIHQLRSERDWQAEFAQVNLMEVKQLRARVIELETAGRAEVKELARALVEAQDERDKAVERRIEERTQLDELIREGKWIDAIELLRTRLQQAEADYQSAGEQAALTAIELQRDRNEAVERLRQAEAEQEAALAVLRDPQKWMRWCDVRVLEANEALTAQFTDLQREREGLQEKLEARDTCVVCTATLLPPDEPPHCEDCHVTDDIENEG